MLLVTEVVEGREEECSEGELCVPFRGEGVVKSLGVLVKATSKDDMEMVHLLYSSSSCADVIEVEDNEEEDFCK